MRPLRLVMTAFGPYAGRQEIDFTQLRGNSLFLINGPTGGGKTTILDAICYALYGETSGKERDDKHLRSDLAAPKEIAEVELTFVVGERQFRAIRSPVQERAKVHGEGTTVQPAKAQLIELGPDGEEQEVLGSKIGQVNDYISELLGFQSDQFRQVIMLPQGKFRELLLASSRDREKILARLFDTSIYRHVEESLKDRTRTLKGEIKELRTTVQARLEHFGFDKVGQLKKKSKGIDKDIGKSAARLRKLEKKTESAQKALSEGRAIEQKFKTAQKDRESLVALEQQIEAMQQRKARLARANQAERLVDIHSRYQDDLAQARQAKTTWKAAERGQQQAATKFEQARIRLAEAEKGAPELVALQAELFRLGGLRRKLAGLEEAQTAFEKVASKTGMAEGALKTKQGEWERVREQRDSAGQALSVLTTKRVDEDLLVLRIDRLEKEIRHRIEVAQAQLDQEQISETLSRMKADLEAKDAAIDSLETQLSDLRSRRAAAHAVLLAGKLEPGAPCPVCGSTEHPEPAAGVEEIPSEEAIDVLDRRVAESKKKRMESDLCIQEILLQSSRLQERIKSGLAALENLPGRSLEAAGQELESLRRQLEQQQTLGRNFQEFTLKAEELKNRLEGLEKECAGLEQQVAKYKLEREAARARMDERKEAIPGHVRDVRALEREMSATETESKRLQQLQETAAKDHAETRDRLTRAEADLLHAAAQLEKLDAAAERSAAEWSERLRGLGFEDEGDFLEARLDSGPRVALESEIDEFERKLERARGLKDASAQSIEGLKRPDLAGLEADCRQITDATDRRREKLAQLKERKAHVTQTLDDLEGSAARLKSLSTEYAVVGGLSSVASGDYNRMSFQRFVLAALLDDVLRQSSERLNSMSKGRYRLHRTNYQGEQRKSGGLDLEVEDAYSGQSRPVSTLSGGESFQAALSLALGLADVVQAYSGGVKLDTIFIDEGFGSLDEEALDLAINTLIDLQATGRLVGVISHVAEMKERIDAQLVVSSGPRGAVAKFRIP